MTVPTGMTVIVGRRKYKAGDELPKGYKEPMSMKAQREKVAKDNVKKIKVEKKENPVPAQKELGE